MTFTVQLEAEPLSRPIFGPNLAGNSFVQEQLFVELFLICSVFSSQSNHGMKSAHTSKAEFALGMFNSFHISSREDEEHIVSRTQRLFTIQLLKAAIK